MAFREDWRHRVALPDSALTRKALESVAECRAQLVESMLCCLDVAFDTDFFLDDFRVDFCCLQTASEYLHTQKIGALPQFDGLLRAMEVGQPYMLWSNAILPPSFSEITPARSQFYTMARGERLCREVTG